MYYVMSLSGGAGSAVAADKAIERYGRSKVVLRFQDTLVEDEDLYRALRDYMQRWGGKLYYHAVGKTPEQIFEEKQLIPNNLLAPCAKALKISPFEAWLWTLPKPVTVLLGLGWHEPHRIYNRNFYHKVAGAWRKPTGYHHRIPGVYEDYPLCWEPMDYRNPIDVVKSWGIDPGIMYAQGFPHFNCGGACVKQGIREWQRLKIYYPERFQAKRDWEQAQRAKGGPRANRAFCTKTENGVTRPITLAEIEQLTIPQEGEIYQEDMFTCHCTEM